MMRGMRQDLPYVIRGVVRSPGFTVAVVVSLSVGIGANIAVFTALDRLLYRPPAGVSQPASVRRLYTEERVWSGPPAINNILSPPDYVDFQQAAHGIARVEAYYTWTNRSLDEGRRVTVGYVTGGFFDLLGVRSNVGSTFAFPERQRAAPAVAVLSHGTWVREFGSDRSIVGRSIRIDTTRFVVSGVLAADFLGLDIDAVDVWVPITSRAVSWNDRGARGFETIVRFRSVGDEQSLAGFLTSRYRVLHVSDSWFDRSATVVFAPLLLSRGPRPLRAQIGRNISLGKTLGAVSLIVLFVSIGNVVSLLLMRCVQRRREIAVRLALGSSRSRVALQLALEAGVLIVVASMFATLVGVWAGELLRAMLLLEPTSTSAPFDRRSLIVALVLCGFTMMTATLASAMFVTRRTALESIRPEQSDVAGRGARARIALLVAQPIFCMVLLAYAGAFVQSLRRGFDADVGFDGDRLITIDATGHPISPAALAETLKRLRSVPGVEMVSSSSADVRPGSQRGPFAVDPSKAIAPDAVPSYNMVDSSYSAAVGLRIVRGRMISSVDIRGSTPVVVVTEQTAKAFWPGTDPVGKCVYIGSSFSTCRRVVGVVRDIRWNLSDPPSTHVFFPMAQTVGPSGSSYVLIRTNGIARATTLKEVDRIAQELLGGPEAHPRVARVSDRLTPLTRPWRAAAALFFVFGILALLATIVGVCGLVNCDVSERRREIGIRIAMGGTARHILSTVVGSAIKTVAAGVIVGVAASIVAGRLVSSFLFETSPHDPLALGVTATLLVLAAVLSAMFPAIRALKTSPALALRDD